MGTVAGMEVSIFFGFTVAVLHINISSEHLYPSWNYGKSAPLTLRIAYDSDWWLDLDSESKVLYPISVFTLFSTQILLIMIVDSFSLSSSGSFTV